MGDPDGRPTEPDVSRGPVTYPQEWNVGIGDKGGLKLPTLAAPRRPRFETAPWVSVDPLDPGV
jgi:hypothetical protein